MPDLFRRRALAENNKRNFEIIIKYAKGVTIPKGAKIEFDFHVPKKL